MLRRSKGIGERGFMNLTAEYLRRDGSNRNEDPFRPHREIGDAAVENHTLYLNGAVGTGEKHCVVAVVEQPAVAFLGIVGRDGGYTRRAADASILVPIVNAKHVTPHTEAFQAVLWHLLVTHPALKMAQTKWESLR